MNFIKQKAALIIEVLFFLTIVIFDYHTYLTTDFWFHLKVGEEIIQKQVITFTDSFSHSVFGRPIIPYEWLYQSLLYLVHSSFGITGVQIMALLILMGYLLLYRQILSEIFHLGVLGRITFCAILSLVTYSYWSERPQIIAFTLFMAILYLVLKLVFTKKNLLWLTPPLFWIWTNLHASMILGLAIFFCYGALFAFRYIKSKDKSDLKLLSYFSLFGLINFAITISPPLYFQVYQLLWKFFKYREIIASFIIEWNPLTQNPTALFIYIGIYILAFCIFVYGIQKRKKYDHWVLFLPLTPIALFALTGARQGPFSLPLILLFFIPFISQINFKLSKTIFITLGLFISLITATVLILFSEAVKNGDLAQTEKFYPTKAVPFIKTNMKGNMFNDYNYGGYLLYSLGPEQKVFVDGRTEMYVPEVFTDAKSLGDHKYEGEVEIQKYFNSLANKYKISWVILPSQNYNVWRILIRILYYQPNWHLVYFDDVTLIFARDDDHQNDQAIKQFSMSSVTPFQKEIYKTGQEDQALNEYLSMYKRAPSAAASNAIGSILYKQQKFNEAKFYFEQAVMLDQSSASAKVNLAEVYLRENRIQEAIILFEQAVKIDPSRISALKRLEQLKVNK